MRQSRRAKSLKCFDVSILGGEFKGKKILIPDISTTRSSKSILRESLFDTLQFEIIGKNFVEVFAGSGSVGIEAISRGAYHGYFIEHNKDALAILEKNIKNVSATNTTVLHGNSFTLFPRLLEQLIEQKMETYFYFDPPFSIRAGMDDIYDKTIALIKMIPQKIVIMIIIEHISKLDLPGKIGAYTLDKKKKFGKSSLSYYIKG